MSLITLIVILCVFAVLVGLILKFGTALGMPEPFPKIIVAVAILGLVLYVLEVFGWLHLGGIRVGHVR